MLIDVLAGYLLRCSAPYRCSSGMLWERDRERLRDALGNSLATFFDPLPTKCYVLGWVVTDYAMQRS